MMDGSATLDSAWLRAREGDGRVTIDDAENVDLAPGESRGTRRIHQATLRNPIGCTGIGLHTGRLINLHLLPAAPDTGLVFCRSDLGHSFTATYDHVVDTRLSTVIADPQHPEAQIATIEHLMAALSACGIDNARIEADGPEIPVFDGSSNAFVFLIDCAGREEQPEPRSGIEILKRVRVEHNGAFAELRPSPSAGLALSMSIAFPAAAIGRQSFSTTLSDQNFRRDLADCRTFTLLSEIDALRAAGLALGGSLDNAVVVDDASILNPAGLRRSDEFVRHKMLDAIGDLALAGHPIHGAFIGHRSGHALNNLLLRALFADSSAWRLSARSTSHSLTGTLFAA